MNCPPILFVQIDGKLRTEHLAKTTVDTSRFVFDARWVIALGVKLFRYF